MIPDLPYHYQASYFHTQVGTNRVAVVTLGVHYTEIVDDPTVGGGDWEALQLAMDFLGGSWVPVMGQLGNAVTYSRFTLQDSEGTIYEKTLSVNGGETDPIAPYSCAYLVKKTSGLPGRHNSGRMYLPGVNETDLDPAGVIAPVKWTPLQAALDAYEAEIRLRHWEPMLFHGPLKATGIAPPPTPVSGFAVDHRIATQRRRMRG